MRSTAAALAGFRAERILKELFEVHADSDHRAFHVIVQPGFQVPHESCPGHPALRSEGIVRRSSTVDCVPTIAGCRRSRRAVELTQSGVDIFDEYKILWIVHCPAQLRMIAPYRIGE